MRALSLGTNFFRISKRGDNARMNKEDKDNIDEPPGGYKCDLLPHSGLERRLLPLLMENSWFGMSGGKFGQPEVKIGRHLNHTTSAIKCKILF